MESTYVDPDQPIAGFSRKANDYLRLVLIKVEHAVLSVQLELDPGLTAAKLIDHVCEAVRQKRQGHAHAYAARRSRIGAGQGTH